MCIGLIYSILFTEFNMSKIKDNAHNLNSPMEFNKNGYTCCLDTTKHDEIEKVGVIMLIM